jgi:hypothetical protein
MKILHATHRATGPELVTKIPLTKGLPYKIYTLRAICVEDIRAGDKFDAFGGFQVTFDGRYPNGNWCNYPVMTCRLLSVTDDLPDQGYLVDAVRPFQGESIDPASGQNIDHPLIHHYRDGLQGDWEAESDFERKWFLMCGYSASALSTGGPKEALDVNLGGGRMWINHYRDLLIAIDDAGYRLCRKECPEGTQNEN